MPVSHRTLLADNESQPLLSRSPLVICLLTQDLIATFSLNQRPTACQCTVVQGKSLLQHASAAGLYEIVVLVSACWCESENAPHTASAVFHACVAPPCIITDVRMKVICVTWPATTLDLGM